MVIISTSAIDVSIHAVSPEFGAQLVSVLASHAGGGASAAGAVGADVALLAAVSAKAGGADGALSTSAATIAAATARRPARENLFNVMISLLFARIGRALKGRGVGLAGPDADGVIEGEHENLAVTDVTGLGGGT